MKISKVKKVKVVGVIASFAFQRAKFCVLELHRKLPQKFPFPEIIGLLELDWTEKLSQWRQEFGQEYWCLRRPVAVFFDDKFIGSDLELLKLTTLGNIVLNNVPRKNVAFIKEEFRKEYISCLRKAKRIFCYLDICIDDTYVGTMTFELYSDMLPRTCENFKSLCLGNKGPLLSYKGSRIHRIVKGGWVQGGDIQYKTGGGGFSIFCDPLEDENFSVSHNRRGILSMANGGRHWNASQFFVTLKPTEWMDTHFVAFGHLVEGSSVLNCIENLETFYECPLKTVEIKSCGKLDLGDVEDIDASYREVPLPKKSPKIFESVSEQVVRLVMEALTEALAQRERAPDVLDDGDVPSKMNLQLYFQGLYSIPEEVLEDSAKYLRDLRRTLLRTLKPSATEVVEVLMYDLLMAVLTRMTTLDDVRETIGRDLYDRMIRGIDMEFELCQKPYVKKLVNQIISTAQSVISVVTKKILKLKIMSTKAHLFQDKMQNWVQSFVRQETFKGHPHHIYDRSTSNTNEKASGFSQPKGQRVKGKEKQREGRPCCDSENKEKKNWEKLFERYHFEDVCCIGSDLLRPASFQFVDYFNECMHKIKRTPRNDEERIPLLDFIENSRLKLRWMRKKEKADKPKSLVSVENKIRKWLEEVVYTPETSWIKNLIFDENEAILDHLEEIMYGAMTAALLEMYYFYEHYLKLCGGRKQKMFSRVIYPEESESSDSSSEKADGKFLREDSVKEETCPVVRAPPCPCGHPCCTCASDPNYRPPTPLPSFEEETEENLYSGVPSPVHEASLADLNLRPACGSGAKLVDLNALLAAKTALKPEEIDIRSFKWLKSYILSKGCDMKTEFATQVHKWIDGETFNYKGFISKHSLATRGSLLSLSVSLTAIITDKNQIKSDIKNFIYDLWDLYFSEMFKEAVLEQPPDESTDQDLKSEKEDEGEDKVQTEAENEDECKKILVETPDFDFSKFCARFATDSGKIEKEPTEEQQEMDFESNDGSELDRKTMAKEEETRMVATEPNEADEKPGENAPAEEEESKPEVKPVASAEKEKIETSVPIQTQAEGTKEKMKKEKRSPTIVYELNEESSGDESRHMPPYVLPFWIKFLTELTKQALGALAKVSRLPRRLYFQTNADLDFDDKMKEWFEFNAFNPQPTKGREIMDYIALHHKSLENLEETARSYLKKKKFTELLNRCTRFSSAEAVADEIVVDVIKSAMKDQGDAETVELYLSNLISSAVASSRRESQTSNEDDVFQENEYQTDTNESMELEDD